MLTIETLYLKFEISKIQLNQYIKMKEVPEKGKKKRPLFTMKGGVWFT